MINYIVTTNENIKSYFVACEISEVNGLYVTLKGTPRSYDHVTPYIGASVYLNDKLKSFSNINTPIGLVSKMSQSNVIVVVDDKASWYGFIKPGKTLLLKALIPLQER